MRVRSLGGQGKNARKTPAIQVYYLELLESSRLIYSYCIWAALPYPESHACRLPDETILHPLRTCLDVTARTLPVYG